MGHQQRGCDNPLRTKGKPSVAVKNTTTLTHKNSQKLLVFEFNFRPHYTPRCGALDRYVFTQNVDLLPL